MNRFASLIDGFVTPCLADSRLRGPIAGMLGGMSDSRLHKLYQLKFQYMVEHISLKYISYVYCDLCILYIVVVDFAIFN